MLQIDHHNLQYKISWEQHSKRTRGDKLLGEVPFVIDVKGGKKSCQKREHDDSRIMMVPINDKWGDC